jgi:hypothetical protein
MQNTHREDQATALYTLVWQHLSESSKSQTFLAQQVILTNYHAYAVQHSILRCFGLNSLP